MRLDNAAVNPLNRQQTDDDLSPAERAMRDEYCGHINLGHPMDEMPRSIIANLHAFEHSASR